MAKCQLCGGRRFPLITHKCDLSRAVPKKDEDDAFETADVTKSPWHESQLFTRSVRDEDIPVLEGTAQRS